MCFCICLALHWLPTAASKAKPRKVWNIQQLSRRWGCQHSKWQNIYMTSMIDHSNRWNQREATLEMQNISKSRFTKKRHLARDMHHTYILTIRDCWFASNLNFRTCITSHCKVPSTTLVAVPLALASHDLTLYIEVRGDAIRGESQLREIL